MSTALAADLGEGAPKTAWKWEYGYDVKLFNADGCSHRSAKTYAEAVTVRDAELSTGRYDFAWLEMKTI